jgi:hypothetical protein
MKRIILMLSLCTFVFYSVAQSWKAGDKVIAKDKVNNWLPAEITAVNGGKYKVHYTGYSSDWKDAWIEASWIKPNSNNTNSKGTNSTNSTKSTAPRMIGALPVMSGSAWKIMSIFGDGRPVSAYLFCPNGKYEIVPPGAGMVVFMGTYRVAGSKLITKAEDGAVTTYTMTWRNGFLELNDGKVVLKLLYDGLSNAPC